LALVLAVVLPMVSAPVFVLVMPLPAIFNVRFAEPVPWIVTALATLIMLTPKTVRSAPPRLIVCAAVSDDALNIATSVAAGSAAGVVPPPTTVDQFCKLPQSPRVPVPALSHH